MVDCIPDETKSFCLHCGWKKPERIVGWPHRNCPSSPDAPPRIPGVGDYLHCSIVRFFGEGISEGCGCGEKIAEMNALGSAGCREHLAELVAYLAGKADEKKWFDEPNSENKRRFRWWKLATKLPGKTLAIELMIRHAIRKSEKAAIASQSSGS